MKLLVDVSSRSWSRVGSSALCWWWVVLAAPAQQVAWSPATPLFPRAAGTLVQDPVPGHVLLFDGARSSTSAPSETWRWDGAVWQQARPAVSPPPRANTVMALDTLRGHVVMFGGLSGANVLADTWEWNGSLWIQINPANSPSARHGAAMTFDPLRGRIVLFGGRDRVSTLLDDTWEYDGTNWSLRTPANRPAARHRASFAFHALTARAVLFGGMAPGTALGDTMTWDGSNWTPVQTTGPSPRAGAPLAPDPSGRLVLLGAADLPAMADTWTFDGTQWSSRAGGLFPASATMALEPLRGVLVAVGRSPTGTVNQVYEYTNGSWLRSTDRAATPPVAGPLVPMGYAGPGDLRPGVPMHGETWFLSDGRWQTRPEPWSPDLQDAVGVFDTERQVTVLFGGRGPQGPSNETWEYSLGWRRVDPGVRPPADPLPLMAFHHSYALLLVRDPFAGEAQTFKWNGMQWARTAYVNGSPVAVRGAMAYDAARQRTVLFGGSDAMGITAQTWEFDGQDWTRLSPATAPSARERHRLAYDEVRSRVVLFGGTPGGAQGFLDDVWEWDGSRWAQLAASGSISARADHGMVYERTLRRLVVFGGRDAGTVAFDDAWALASVRPATASVTSVNTSCAGTAGWVQLQIANGALPWLGDPLRIELSRLPWFRSAVFLLGASNEMLGSVRLPLDLGAIGMPGCRLGVAPIVAVPAISFLGLANLNLSVPNDPSLVGGRCYVQGLAEDQGINAFGATTSTLLSMQFGRR
jgi:hypothetical protein